MSEDTVQDAEMAVKQPNNKLVGRDFITIGIFSLIMIVVVFTIATIMGVIPGVGFLFSYAVSAIPVGIIFMYVVAKVPKTGAIALMMTVQSLIFFLMGAPGFMPLGSLVGGIIAEVIISSGKYKSFVRNTIGYVFLMTIWWFGHMFTMIFATEAYIVEMEASGISAESLQPMLNFINGPFFFLVLAATIVGAFLGALLGRKTLKKHFEKAGIV